MARPPGIAPGSCSVTARIGEGGMGEVATVLTSLNQSNISHIHGLAEAAGKKALPLELVEPVTNVDPVSPS